MTLADLLEQCRSDAAVAKAQADRMHCRSMRPAKAGLEAKAEALRMAAEHLAQAATEGTAAGLSARWRSRAADYLRHTKGMRSPAMAEESARYVGRATALLGLADRLEAMIAEGASEPKARSRKAVAKAVRNGPLAEAEATAAGEGATVPDLPEGREADAGNSL